VEQSPADETAAPGKAVDLLETLKRAQTPLGGVLIGGGAAVAIFAGWAGDIVAVAAAATGALLLAGSFMKLLPGNRSGTDNNPLKHMLTRERFEKEVLWRLLRREATGGLIVTMQLEELKLLNELYGHASGDVALVRYSERMQELLGPEALLGRSLGDEFVAFLPSYSELDAETIEALKSPPRQFSLGANIGYAPLRLPARFSDRNGDDRKDAAIVALKTAIVEARTAMREDADVRPPKAPRRPGPVSEKQETAGPPPLADDERPGFERLRKLEEATAPATVVAARREPLLLFQRRSYQAKNGASEAMSFAKASPADVPAPAVLYPEVAGGLALEASLTAEPARDQVKTEGPVTAPESPLLLESPAPRPPEVPAQTALVEEPPAAGNDAPFAMDIASLFVEPSAVEAAASTTTDDSPPENQPAAAEATSSWFSDEPAVEPDFPIDPSFPPLVRLPEEGAGEPEPAAAGADFRLTPGSWLRR
jgi:GGDEF domain-containing protein